MITMHVRYFLIFLTFFVLADESSSNITSNTTRRLFEIALPYLKFYRVQIGVGERCIPQLGCFSNTGEFYHPVYRPISVAPESRETIDTRFTLYTKDAPNDPVNITADPEVIRNTNYNPIRKTIFVIHGFYFDNYFGMYQQGAFKELREVLFADQDINMIFTDWGRGASTWYLQATANARVVGAEVGLLANTLIDKFGADPKNFHIIGHSLGSHIAGYAGARIKNLGRITGLDPAKPYFDRMPLIARLDPTDALFVDVIHTNSPTITQPFGFGTRDLIGDIDYYPNNGNTQPGCIREKVEAFTKIDFAYGLRKSSVCNHARSVWFLTEAIKNKKCKMFAFRCPNHIMFKDGECWKCGPNNEGCRIMGEFYPTGGVKYANFEGYYLLTHSQPPFCAYQYRVELSLESLPRCALNQMVRFKTSLHANKVRGKGMSRPVTLTSSNKKVAFIALSHAEINQVESMNIQWRTLDDKLKGESFSNCTLAVTRIAITPLNMFDDQLKERLTQIYENEGLPLRSGQKLTLSLL